MIKKKFIIEKDIKSSKLYLNNVRFLEQLILELIISKNKIYKYYINTKINETEYEFENFEELIKIIDIDTTSNYLSFNCYFDSGYLDVTMNDIYINYRISTVDEALYLLVQKRLDEFFAGVRTKYWFFKSRIGDIIYGGMISCLFIFSTYTSISLIKLWDLRNFITLLALIVLFFLTLYVHSSKVTPFIKIYFFSKPKKKINFAIVSWIISTVLIIFDLGMRLYDLLKINNNP